MPRKQPFRAANDITQQFNSGIVKIYRVEDAAKPGYQPKEQLSLKEKLPFEERALEINRLYLSRQNQAEISRVIRVPRRNISPQDRAETNDGKIYRVDTVQAAEGIRPPSLDLSLVLIEQKHEVMPK